MKTPRPIHVTPELRVKVRELLIDAETTPTGCTECTCGSFTSGYGCVRVGTKVFIAHRVVWTVVKGPIPRNLWLLHRCDNRKCINVDHLFLGTPTDNNADCILKKRFVAGRHPRVKQDPEIVREIRSLWSTGWWEQSAIGELFDIDQSSVSRVVNHQQWKFVS